MRVLLLSLMLLSCQCAHGQTPNLDELPPRKDPGAEIILPKYLIVGEITPDSANAFVQMMRLYARAHVKQIPILFNSPGGDYMAGLAMIDAIQYAPFKTVCIVPHEAASMAFAVFEACTVRVIGAPAQLMAHQVRRERVEMASVDQLKNVIHDLEISNLVYASQCSGRSSMSLADFQSRVSGERELLLGADEAVRLGFADRIGRDLSRELSSAFKP